MDILADIAGGIYCLTVGDIDNARIYGSGAFLPVAGGALRLGKGAIKGIAKGSKTLVRINGKLALLPDFRFDVYTFLQHKMPDELDNIQKLHDKIVKHKVVSDNFTIEFAELLVKAGEGRTQVLAQIGKWDKKALNALSKDLKNPKFAKEFFEIVADDIGVIDVWKYIQETDYSSNTEFYKRVNNLSKESGESLSHIVNNRIPEVKKSDDFKRWVDLLSEDGLSKKASDLLDIEVASSLENFSNNRRPGAAAVMEGDNYQPISATSIRNGNVEYFEGINPLVKDILEQIRKSGIESNGHGKCAEVKILSDILNNHFKNKVPTLDEAIDYLRGTKSKAVSLKRSAKNAGSHGKFKCACISCTPLMKRLKVLEVSH